ncbi:MAG: flagellar hook-length control protein FliK [Blastomonas sp.]
MSLFINQSLSGSSLLSLSVGMLPASTGEMTDSGFLAMADQSAAQFASRDAEMLARAPLPGMVTPETRTIADDATDLGDDARIARNTAHAEQDEADPGQGTPALLSLFGEIEKVLPERVRPERTESGAPSLDADSSSDLTGMGEGDAAIAAPYGRKASAANSEQHAPVGPNRVAISDNGDARDAEPVRFTRLANSQQSAPAAPAPVKAPVKAPVPTRTIAAETRLVTGPEAGDTQSDGIIRTSPDAVPAANNAPTNTPAREPVITRPAKPRTTIRAEANPKADAAPIVTDTVMAQPVPAADTVRIIADRQAERPAPAMRTAPERAPAEPVTRTAESGKVIDNSAEIRTASHDEAPDRKVRIARDAAPEALTQPVTVTPMAQPVAQALPVDSDITNATEAEGGDRPILPAATNEPVRQPRMAATEQASEATRSSEPALRMPEPAAAPARPVETSAPMPRTMAPSADARPTRRAARDTAPLVDGDLPLASERTNAPQPLPASTYPANEALMATARTVSGEDLSGETTAPRIFANNPVPAATPATVNTPAPRSETLSNMQQPAEATLQRSAATARPAARTIPGNPVQNEANGWNTAMAALHNAGQQVQNGGQVQAAASSEAAAAAAQNAPVPFDAGFIDRIGQEIAILAKGPNMVKLQLMPENLGRIDIELVSSDHQDQVRIVTESDAVRQTLAGAQNRLEQDMRQANNRQAEISVELRQQQGGMAGQSSGQQRGGAEQQPAHYRNTASQDGSRSGEEAVRQPRNPREDGVRYA